jgi:hypothetical protein
MYGISRLAALSLSLAVSAIVVLAVGSLAPPAAAQPREAPVAVVVLVEGTSAFMGNDAYARAETCQATRPGTLCRVVRTTPGAHAALVAALGAGRRGLGHRLGRGARASLLTYGRTSTIALPMGPAARLSGKALGPQRTYADRSERNLADGLTAALETLTATPARRRAVVVIGAGLTSRDVDLAAIKARYGAAGVSIFYLQWNPSPTLIPEDDTAAGRLRAVLGDGDDGSVAIRLAGASDLGPALTTVLEGLRAVPAPTAPR